MMKHYENPSIGVKIIELDDAYQMCTKSEMYEYLIKIARQPKAPCPDGCSSGDAVHHRL